MNHFYGGKNMKRIISALIIILIVAACTLSASAIDYGCTVEPVSHAVYVEELNSGTTVYQHNADEIVYPASTTKIMTFIIVAENIPDYDAVKIKVTSEALSTMDPESSVMGLTDHIGESFTVRDLLYGLMLPSGNDAALVLADYVGHGVAGFVDLMNRKAAQIGCANTHFTSPHGLHDSQHYSTARDMATIAKFALHKKDFMTICNTVSYTPQGFSYPIKTTNYLIDSSAEGGEYYYPDAKGIKTGYTDQAGKCLVSTAERDGYTYLCVALGAGYSFAEDINYAMLDSAEIYDWALNDLHTQTVFNSTSAVTSIPVLYVWGNKMLDLVPEESVTALLPDDYDPYLIATKLDCKDYATAPVEKGEIMGTLTVYYDNSMIGRTNVVSTEKIDLQTSNLIAHSIVDWIRGHVVITVIIFVVLLLLLLIVIDRIRMRKALRERARKDK